MSATTWVTLVRREFWENRALWIAPLIAAGFLLLGSIVLASHAASIQFGPSRLDLADALHGMEVSVLIYGAMILGVGTLATMAFLLDCLCTERKDRSILFWKSLPVSDWQTVAAKLAVAGIVMPAGVLVLTVLTHLLSTLVLSINPPPASPIPLVWHGGALFGAYVRLAGLVVLNTLWYAPLMVYAMLASVLARRAPLVTAALPLIVLAAGERTLLGTAHFWNWLWHRAGFVVSSHTWGLPELWIGVLVAGLLLPVVVRLRRYSDDS